VTIPRPSKTQGVPHSSRLIVVVPPRRRCLQTSSFFIPTSHFPLLGPAPADTFLRDAHPDLKADFVLANPPFNVSDYSGPLLRGDKRWTFGDPPVGNANYAWVQNFIQRRAVGGGDPNSTPESRT